MSVQPGYTNEDIVRLVLEYEQQPHGTKSAWAAERGISSSRLRRWRRAVFDGDLQRGLIPREGTPLTMATHRRRISKQLMDPYEENARLRARNAELEAVNESLGKAIGLLHAITDQEPAVEQDTSSRQGPQSSPESRTP